MPTWDELNKVAKGGSDFKSVSGFSYDQKSGGMWGYMNDEARKQVGDYSRKQFYNKVQAQEDIAKEYRQKAEESQNYYNKLKSIVNFPSTVGEAVGNFGYEAVTHPAQTLDTVGGALTFGARNLLRDAVQATHYQLGGEQTIEDINAKARQSKIDLVNNVSKRTDLTPEDKKRILHNISGAVQSIKAGDIYDFGNKTSGQIGGEAVGSLADYLMFRSLSTGLKEAMSAGKESGIIDFLKTKDGAKWLAEKVITGGAEMGFGGLGVGLSEGEQIGSPELASRIKRDTAIGAVAAPLFELGGAGLSKLISRVAEKSLVNSTVKELESKIGKLGEDDIAHVTELVQKKTPPEEIAKIMEERKALSEAVDNTGTKTVKEFIESRPNLKVETVKTLGKDLENNNIASRLEWDYNNNTGTLLVTPKTTEDALAHEVGHYIEKANPEIATIYRSEIESLAGKGKNLNEALADSVHQLLTNATKIDQAPGLAKELETMGLKLAEQSVISKEVLVKQSLGKKVEFMTNKEIASLPPRDRSDYISNIQGKVSNLRQPNEGERIVIQSGSGRYVDTDVRVALNRGTNKNTRVFIVPSNILEKPSAGKAARGERLLPENYDINSAIEKSRVAKSSASTKKTSLPYSVKKSAENTYKEKVAQGVSKEEAKKIATKEATDYEVRATKASKDVPVLETLVEERRKTGPTPRKKVKTDGINWGTINTSADTEDILKTIYSENDQFKNVRPSRTNKDIIEGARAVGIDVNDKEALSNLLKNMPNANEAVKLKQAMVDSASDLMNYLKTVDTGNLTVEETNKIRDKFLRTRAIAETFSGLRTESAHLLRSMGIETKEGENLALLGQELGRILKESDGNAIDFLGKSAEMIKPTTGDKALAVWYNAMLSGWKTWSRNILDNTGILATETISKLANPQTMVEGTRFIAGLLRALPESFTKSTRIIFGLEEGSNKLAMNKRFLPYFKNKQANLWLTEIAGRVLDAQDVLFSNTIKEAEKSVGSFAKKMADSGIDERTAVQLNDAILTQFSERSTYRNKPMGNVGKIARHVSNLTSDIKGLKIIIPFTNVVSNVIDRKLDYILPTAITRTFGKEYLENEAKIILKKTNIPPSKYAELMPVITKRLRQQQLGRLVLGTTVSIAATNMAMNGLVTGGGPKNLNEKAQLQETGWRPYSIKIGKTYVPYMYLGPLSGILAMAGSIGDAVKYGGLKKDIPTKISNGLVGFMQSNLSQSFLSGTADLISVMNGQKDPKRWLTSLATGMIPVPAMYSQTMQAYDGKPYDVQTLEEAIKYRIGITKDIPPRLNALGEEMRNDIIYGLTPSEEKNNLSKRISDMGLVLNIPAKTTQLEGKPMTRQQLFDYTIERGNIFKNNADKILSALEKEKNPTTRGKMWDKVIGDIEDRAKESIVEKYDVDKKRTTRSIIPSIIIK